MRNGTKSRRLVRTWGRPVQVEALEARQLLSTFTPAQITSAYAFNGITFSTSGGTVAGNGAGETIALVDAYNDTHISQDLSAFDTLYGLPNTNVLTTELMGGSSEQYNSGWALETALDVEWAHAIAPGAKILLVEANTSNLSDLLSAVSYASAHANVVSMSWGTNEFLGETAYDSYFTTPGVTYVAAAGDTGATPIWPAVSPNVIGVGGTTLMLTSSNAWSSETAWSSGGGGISADESIPAYQQNLDGVNGSSTTHRNSPDVSYDADPGTGLSVYDSGWLTVGGTSAGALEWAALVTIADQGRSLAGMGSLSGASQTLPALYASSGDFHDITSGSSTTGGRRPTTYSAGPGYDLVTGLGSPVADLVVRSLVGWTGGASSGGSGGSGGSSGSSGGGSSGGGGSGHGGRNAPWDPPYRGRGSGYRYDEAGSASAVGLGGAPGQMNGAAVRLVQPDGAASTAPQGLVVAAADMRELEYGPGLAAVAPAVGQEEGAKPQAAQGAVGEGGLRARLFAIQPIAGDVAEVMPRGSAIEDLTMRLAPAAAMTSDSHQAATRPMAFAVGMAAVAGMYVYVSRSIEQGRRKIVLDRFMVPVRG